MDESKNGLSMYDKINALMIEEGLSTKALASKAGIPYTTLLSALKRKSSRFSLDYIIKIAVALGVEPDYLLEKSQEIILTAVVDKGTTDLDIEIASGQALDLLEETEKNKLLKGIVRRLKTMNSEELEAVAGMIQILNKISRY